MKNLHLCTRFEKGGGGSPAMLAQSPVPTPAPPVAPTNPEIVQAAEDIKQQELLRKSIKKTVFAGDTGGFRPLANPMKPSPTAMPGPKGG